MDKKIIKFDDAEIEEYEFHQYKTPISINDIDINDTVVSNKFSFDKQDFKYFIGCKDNNKIRPLCIFFPKMSIYKRYSDKTKCMYFMIEDEKIFDKYMTILEKVSHIIKKLNTGLICNKKHLKAEKRFNTKEGFQCFYIPVILFDSAYRKDRNYYPRVFLERFIHNFFWRNIKKNCFWGFESSS